MDWHIYLLKTIFIFICVSTIVFCSHDLYCRDEKNQKVDWFVNYKIPKLEQEAPGSFLAEGEAYAYITSSNSEYWTFSPNSIRSKSSMLGHTVQHLLDVKKKASYLFYNDEPPVSFNGTAKGHLKGIIAFDKTSGFWLIHSIPKFSGVDKYEYPSNALSNGQSVLCISFHTTTLNAICHQLLFSHPKIYEYGITSDILEFLDDKAKTTFTDKPAFIKKPPFKNTAVLKSMNKEIFLSFVKDNQLEEDIYSQIVAPSLGTSMATETWRRGSGTILPPHCNSNYTILDINFINMTVSEKSLFFKSTEDHSKWAVSINSVLPWICIGDLNRMESQAKRGGGTVCFHSRNVWNAYTSIIGETDKCPISFENSIFL